MSTRCIIFGTSNQCADVADARRGTLRNCLPNVNASVTHWGPARVICYLPQCGDHICLGQFVLVSGDLGSQLNSLNSHSQIDPNVETSVRPRGTKKGGTKKGWPQG